MRVLFVLMSLLMMQVSFSHDTLRTGMYRGIIERPDGQQIVFNFETTIENNKLLLYVINGEERMEVDQFQEEGDSLAILLPFFESSFRVKVKPHGDLEGYWVKKLADRDQWLPFHADFNNDQRFISTAPASYNVGGRWAVNFFNTRSKKESKGVGEFQQDGNRVTGSFLTNDGDYRFLEGIVIKDSVLMSGFDGGFAVVFKARINSKNKISGGKLFTGSIGEVNWEAVRDEDAKLDDEYQQTKMKEGQTRLNFSFEEINGEKISINDERYNGKVTIIQILGTWCPNCIDETNYLVDIYNRYNKKGVELLALAYERSTDTARSVAALKKLQKRLNIPYPILNTGVTSTDPYLTEKTLPQVDRIKVFPTSIIIDRKGNVRKIHTGFSGPGTGVHYEEHKKHFEELLEQLIAE